ncbi:MAG: hypothetical protein M1814_001285 [Vezdaea aestivalis]|nr:MAG: hypothetical protein M1814_001285 [Vezdaea aestivalis]
MVLLLMTEAIVAAVNLHRSLAQRGSLKSGSTNFSATGQPNLENPQVGNAISHHQLICLSRSLQRTQESGDGKLEFSLEHLLKHSSVYIPPPPPKSEPTLKFKALMAKLRKEEEAQKYEKMLNPSHVLDSFSQKTLQPSFTTLFPASVQPIKSEEDDVTFADIKRQIAMIANVLLSIICCAVAIWMMSWPWSTPRRLGLSMAGGGVVGIAEVVIYAGYLNRIKSAKDKEKSKREVKETIRSWVLGATEEGSTDNVTLPAIQNRADMRKEVRNRKSHKA